MTIREFLAEHGLEKYTEAFEENGIDIEILPELEESDLADLGIKMLGHRKKLMKAIRMQGSSSKEAMAGAAPEAQETKAEASEPEPRKPAFSKRSIPSAASSDRAKRRVSRQDLLSTIVEQAGSSEETPSPPPPSPRSSPSRQRIKSLKRSTRDRIPAVSAKKDTQDTVEMSTPPAQMATEETPAPVARPRKKKQSGFSETQWFMAGAQQDADILEAQSDQVDYDHDESISEEARKAFTLRGDED